MFDPVAEPEMEPRAAFFVADSTCLALSRDGTRLAVGSHDKTVRVYDMQLEKEIAVLAGHDEPVCSVALSTDGRSLASAGKDKAIHFWDVAKKQRLRTVEVVHEKPLVRFMPDGKTLVVSGYANGVKMIDFETGRVENSFGFGREVEAMDVTPDGKFLALANSDVRLWDLTTRKDRVLARGHTGVIYAVALGADGKTLVTGSADKTVRIWDIATGEQRLLLPQSQAVRSMLMTPDGKLLVTCGEREGLIRIRDAKTGEAITTLYTFGNLAVSTDGKTLVTGAGRQWVKVWDLAGVGGQ